MELLSLGALRCCEEIGMKWSNLGGTSAGAITASLLASNYTVDELEKLMGDLDYTQFLSQNTIAITGFNLAAIGDLMLNSKLGQYSTEPFYNWIKEQLNKKNIETFADLKHNKRVLKIIATDLTRAEMIVCPDSFSSEHPHYSLAIPEGIENFEVAKAVLMSMSIPVFFEPFRLKDNIVVDGGVTSNFPLWLLDCPEGEEPECPTFGFRLVDTTATPNIDSPLDLIKGLIRAMRYSHDRFYLQHKDQGRVINLDLTGIDVTATKFNLTDEDKAMLYVRGYQCTRRFLLNTWSWKTHLEARNIRDSIAK